MPLADQNKIDRILEITGWEKLKRSNLITDTSDWTQIFRGDLLKFGSKEFVVLGNRYETRFGIEEQPKYWVFSVIDMETAQKKIIKMVFHEEFDVRIGVFKMHCFRSPEKEGRVLDLTKGDTRFMQGYTVEDDKANQIRVLDFIKGPNLMENIYECKKSHEAYFYEELPEILKNLVECIRAIHLLHSNHTCHGDIRNDHILIDAETDQYRWIDFDLNQHVPDFDTWSMGNIINYAVGKGINAFSSVLKSKKFSDEIKTSLTPDDASAFYEYRIMNLSKLYPYLPKRLNDILLHFTIKPDVYYKSLSGLIRDYTEVLDKDFKI